MQVRSPRHAFFRRLAVAGGVAALALFAVGAMMLLVVMVRPFFAQRTADKLVEQTRAPTIER